MITPKQYKEFSTELSQFANKQRELTVGSGIDLSINEGKTSDELQNLENDLMEGYLRVLVMGKFSSGKSTFLNALMGQDILPTDIRPTTAVIGEILYAEMSAATLFYKEEVNKKPLDINVKDLGKYIVIKHENADEDEEDKPLPYSKVVVKYPLDICKQGIELVDSPGLDDPTCHDAITLNYLPFADAIVYCMNAQQAFSALDKAEIERLRSLGYTSIIFILTYFDCIEQNDAITGKRQAQEAKNHYVEILKPYTDLGANGIFFVGSLPALMGKIRKDSKLLQSSHLPEAEKKLYEILFNERGRLKLIKAIYSVKRANRDTQRYLSDQIELLAQDKSKLAKNMSAAEENLRKAKEKADLILDNLKTGLDGIVKGTESRARSFLVTDVIPHIGEWVSAYKPQTGISMWKPKKTGKAYTEECVKFIQTKIETTVSNWCREKLVPQYIEPKLRELVEQQGASIETYQKDLDAVRGNLSLTIVTDGPEITTGNRIGAAIVGTLTGGGAVVGGLIGWDGVLPSVISQIVAYVVVSIVALFTPVGLPAYIVGAVIATLVGGGFGTTKIEKKVKKAIGDKATAEITNQQQAFVDGITQGLQQTADKIYEAAKSNLYTPVNQYKQLLSEANSNMTAEGKTIGNQIALKKAMQKDNTLIADNLEDLAQKMNLNL